MLKEYGKTECEDMRTEPGENAYNGLLPSYFLFTQYSLATFENCPLKFKKRYIENLKWDTFPDDSVRKRLEQGNSFHLMAQRYFLGIDDGLDSATEDYGDLQPWMESLEARFPISADAVYLPEYKLRMSSGTIRLEANFDLLVVRGDSVEIWDWKTHGEKNLKKNRSDNNAKRLTESPQTMVYLYVLKEQLMHVIKSHETPVKISMHYWQPEPPGVLARVEYTEEKHRLFGDMLKKRIETILEYDYSCFDKENYRKHCSYCEFNWFCNNERVDFKAMGEEDFLEELSWDDIEEKF